MEPYRLDELPPISPSAHDRAKTIRGAIRDREHQRIYARQRGEEVYVAVLVQQWASSLSRWIKSGEQRDQEAVRRAVARCNEMVTRRVAQSCSERTTAPHF